MRAELGFSLVDSIVYMKREHSSIQGYMKRIYASVMIICTVLEINKLFSFLICSFIHAAFDIKIIIIAFYSFVLICSFNLSYSI